MAKSFMFTYCFNTRESIAISTIYSGLADIAQLSGRLAEAEGWYRRAMDINERLGNTKSLAFDFNNIAMTILHGIKTGQHLPERLVEVKQYADKSLAFKENLDEESAIWTTYDILAEVAEAQDEIEIAREYRRHARRTFANFVGNRYRINQQYWWFISTAAAAGQKDTRARAAAEIDFPKMRADGWGNVVDAIDRIWAGERNWQNLYDNLDNQQALFVLRILETMQQPTAFNVVEAFIALQTFDSLFLAIATATLDDVARKSELEVTLSYLQQQGRHLKEVSQKIWQGERDIEILSTGLNFLDRSIIQRILHLLQGASDEELIAANMPYSSQSAYARLSLYRRALAASRQEDNDIKSYALVAFGDAALHLSSFQGQERLLLLQQALEAYEEAVSKYNPEVLPLSYMIMQRKQAIVLREIANLSLSDRRARLLQGLEACERALRHCDIASASHEYAETKHIHALVLWDISTLKGEDQRSRLNEALHCCIEAVRYRDPVENPLEYARTQHDRAVLLFELAEHSGDDASNLLHEALAILDEVLQYRKAETDPRLYAATQNERGNVLRLLSGIPDEDRATRLREALAAYDIALEFYDFEIDAFNYKGTEQNRALILADLAVLPGEDKAARLHEVLTIFDELLIYYRSENAPNHYIIAAQTNRAQILFRISSLQGEDKISRLETALLSSWEGWRMAEQLYHQHYSQFNQDILQTIRVACGDKFEAIWERLDIGSYPSWLASDSEGVQQEQFNQALELFTTLGNQAVDEEELRADLWQPVVDAGEALLKLSNYDMLGTNISELNREVARAYHILGNILYNSKELEATLHALGRSIILYPYEANYHVDYAHCLIELGRLAEAATVIERVQNLDPNTESLPELEKSLLSAKLNSE